MVGLYHETEDVVLLLVAFMVEMMGHNLYLVGYMLVLGW
jgi:hypothetical protein